MLKRIESEKVTGLGNLEDNRRLSKNRMRRLRLIKQVTGGQKKESSSLDKHTCGGR